MPSRALPKPQRGGNTEWLTGSKIREKAPLPVARSLDEPLSLPAKPGFWNDQRRPNGKRRSEFAFIGHFEKCSAQEQTRQGISTA